MSERGWESVSPSLWKWPVIATWGSGPVINQRRGAGTEGQAARPTYSLCFHLLKITLKCVQVSKVKEKVGGPR